MCSVELPKLVGWRQGSSCIFSEDRVLLRQKAMWNQSDVLIVTALSCCRTVPAL